MDYWLGVLFGGLGGSALATLIQYVWRENREAAQRSSAKQAIQAVMSFAADSAQGYLKPKAVFSPGGRIQTELFVHGMEVLLSLRALDRENTGALLRYLGAIDAFNRSPDAIADLLATRHNEGANAAALAREISRARLKAIGMVAKDQLAELLRLGTTFLEDKEDIEAKLKKFPEGMPYDLAMHALMLL